ncbi:thiamine pyrophosphate-binding protein [Syntrophomonas palmitatica]|uniref:thiamine pyrophosphate-binding protein n=1 Tax=Syntrophomonas palmitatica TaxID=402877 RepID=UPI000B2BBA7E|nr:thiamine pyrophosphate-binding protein [Syntrophomonas palmitatica]
MRVADYVIQRIYEEGAQHIFMVTGRGILYLSDAVAKHKDIIPISVHHEQSGAYAAVAYAQYNEKIGACLVSTGCASTNAITGVLNAWQDGVPCIFISGQNKLYETVRYTGINIRTFGSQETDIISIIKPITKYCTMIDDPQNIALEMDKAFFFAKSGRKGPVWIDIPVDVQNMRVEPEELQRYVPDDIIFKPDPEDIQYIRKELKKAKRPVILIGSGIRSANAVEEFKAFLKKNPFPVTFACSAVDTYGADYELSIGAVGSIGGTRAGNFAVQNSDLLLVLGCRLSPMTTGSEYEKFARAAQIIVIDIDRIEHSKNTVRIDRLVVSDLKEFIEQLNNEDLKCADKEWIKKCIHWKTIFPKCEEKYRASEKIDLYYLADCLSKLMDDNFVLLSDAGLEEIIIPSTISFKAGQRCIHPVSQGSMGFALPASIGAYYASKHPITAVIGDGSIMMNLQELQTIKYYNIPVRIIIINNNVYSVIRTRQKDIFRTRTIGTDYTNGVSCPNFNKVAECFDIPYMIIDNKNDLEDKLDKLLRVNGPIICEIFCDENQEFIRNSYALNSQRRIVNRSLEDQAPFMNRELFLKEMIIDPIDQ